MKNFYQTKEVGNLLKEQILFFVPGEFAIGNI